MIQLLIHARTLAVTPHCFCTICANVNTVKKKRANNFLPSWTSECHPIRVHGPHSENHWSNPTSFSTWRTRGPEKFCHWPNLSSPVHLHVVLISTIPNSLFFLLYHTQSNLTVTNIIFKTTIYDLKSKQANIILICLGLNLKHF